MYAQHFNLTSEPFPLTPDPANLYLGKQHREALAALKYGLVERRAFVTLVGEVGTGKTSVVYALLRDPGPNVHTAYLAYPTQSFEDILASLVQDLGVATPARTKRELLAALNEHLARRAKEGGTTALVIDEAQDLSDQALEELRLLSNFETYSEKLVQIVLVGQPELRERLASPRLRQLRERIAVRAILAPLSRSEMLAYIEHRLRGTGGSTDRLFTRAALRLIVRRSAGIPRRANILCHNALLFAYGRGIPRVTARVAREAIAEMGERRPGAATSRRVLAGSIAAGVAILVMTAAVGSRSRTEVPPVVSSPDVPAAIDVVRADTVAPPPPAPAAPVPPEPAQREPVPPTPSPVAEPAAGSPPPAAKSGERVAVAAVALAESPRARVKPPSRREPLIVTVKDGTTLFGLVRSVYGPGVRLDRVYAEVRRLNPELTDPSRIRAGTSLRLPPKDHEYVLR